MLFSNLRLHITSFICYALFKLALEHYFLSQFFYCLKKDLLHEKILKPSSLFIRTSFDIIMPLSIL
jgi:hypothetical protein